MAALRDHLGRTFKTLRISLINTCNLACTYCTYGNDESKENYTQHKSNVISVHEMLNLIKRLHARLELTTIRFTGGEPLLYKDLTTLIARTSELGIDNLNLTTNGLLLQKIAPALKAAGLRSVNVSLDAIDPLTFFKMSRRHGLEQTLSGIEAAINEGIEVKLNAVIMKGMNDSQVIPLLKFAFSKNIKIRFLEIMSMGHLHGKIDEYFFSQKEILSLINRHYSFSPVSRSDSATANYWKTEEGHHFGIIANESHPFCADCNRLRLDAYGNIYGCLSNNNPVSITHTNTAGFDFKLREALAQKQSIKFTGSKLSMLHIGG
jgi:Molybdenum cofactor biosynthesis enzyme